MTVLTTVFALDTGLRDRETSLGRSSRVFDRIDELSEKHKDVQKIPLVVG